MTTYSTPRPLLDAVDGETMATPLAMMKSVLHGSGSLADLPSSLIYLSG